MKNKQYLSILFLFILLFSIVNVSGFMPKYTHPYIHPEAVSVPQSSELYNACVKYPNLCYSGNVLTDISVLWYWTEGSKYAVTHQPSFCRNMITAAGGDDQQLACAVGACLHQPADIVSHNEMVPYSIENSLLINVLIHVFAEQKVDNWVEDKYPQGEQIIDASLEDYETCIPLFEKVMLGYDEYNDENKQSLDDKFDKFVTEIVNSQTGYDSAFKNKSFLVNFNAIPLSVLIGYIMSMFLWFILLLLLLVKVFRKDLRLRVFIAILIFGTLFFMQGYIFYSNFSGQAYSSVINIAAPISNLVPLGNSEEYYVNKAIQNSVEFLNQGEIWLTSSDASGFDSLEEADRKVLLFDYFIVGTFILSLLWFIWYVFKTPKKKK